MSKKKFKKKKGPVFSTKKRKYRLNDRAKGTAAETESKTSRRGRKSTKGRRK